jgi:predicted glycogen debranching enzyme
MSLASDGLSYSVDVGGRLQPHLAQEWLLTNGLGAFSSSSVVGCNTRRYHGVLVAATLPPVGRIMTVNRIGETLRFEGDEHLREFSVNQFAEGFHPRGYQYLRRFDLWDTARWEYDVEGVRVVKELQLLWMKNVAAVRYTVKPPKGRRVELGLLPFVSLRDFHNARHAGDVLFNVGVAPDRRSIQVGYGTMGTHVWSDAGHFVDGPDWWYDHKYNVETDRGIDDTEDLFTPGKFVVDAAGGEATTVTLWTALNPGSYDWDEELKRRRDAVGTTTQRLATPTLKRLGRAANDFVVYRKAPDGGDGTSVLAGYPWFADWGRDTFISLPGLLLTTGRFTEAKQVLTVFASYVSQGMIPNRFDDYNNEPHYNTVDASLWFIHAAHEYLRLSGDQATFDSVLGPACRAIIDGYRDGTRFGIRMDPKDGLILQGDEQTQLTWMDAKCGAVAYTPRQGKPVEINALWYNALRVMKEDALADRVLEHFERTFWISPFRGLCDVVDGSRRDASVRPNQIFAVSLPHSALSEDQQHAVVEVVRRELLTPYGLRTLARSDSNYRGRYCGPQPTRDAAYHNGAIWPWLIGGFLDAYLKVNHRTPQAAEQAKQWLRPLLDHMESDACIGQISEIFEADEPHRPVGCPAQAWSVAEVLRLAVELGM